MPRTFAANIAETSTTPGTGSYNIDGPAPGYLPFSSQYVNGDTPYYAVRSKDETKFEFNKGTTTITLGTPTVLGRAVWLSSNNNLPVIWTEEDFPLTIYVPSSYEAMELMVNGWLATARDSIFKFGQWFKKDGGGTNKHQWMIFDGVSDIVLGVIDSAAHTFTPAFSAVPPGFIGDYAGATAPTGWLFCRGQSVTVAAYPTLHAAIGYQYGGAGANFNVPDLMGTVTAGLETTAGGSRLTVAGSGINGSVLGARGGAQTVTLDANTLPAHGHLLSSAASRVVSQVGPGAFAWFDGTGTHTAALTGDMNTNQTGGGLAHQNTQPTIVMNKIIKT